MKRIVFGLLAVLYAATAAFAQEPPYLGDPPSAPSEAEVAKWRSLASSQMASSGGFVVNVASREEVRTFYNAVFKSSEGVASGWNGNVATCTPGTTSTDYRDAGVRRINYYRAMAGVPASIAFGATNNAKCQQAALMMSANNALSHSPPPSWTCYTADGAQAAGNSNLALGLAGPGAIRLYMNDPGAGNTAVGHRRWILYPQTQTMGTGDIPSGSGFSAANALWAWDTHVFGPRPGTRDSFVSWPPPGHVPYREVWNRWSFSYAAADFSGATVTMSTNGTGIPVTQHAVANGFGENTLVWYPSHLDPGSGAGWSKPAVDTPYQINIQNVVISGAPQAFNYTVTLFDPDTTGPDTVVPVISGSDSPIVNQSNPYTFTPVPNATGYEWLHRRRAAHTDVEGAEEGLTDFITDVSPGYAVVVNSPVASGSAAFHLAHPSPVTDQTLTYNHLLLPGANAQLQFKSRLGYATASQFAKVQVRIDGGTTWTDVYSQAGTGGSGETTYNMRAVSLAAYAGIPIHVRFNYAFPGSGSYYPQTSAGFGWYFDDIAFTDTDALTSPVVTAVSAGTSFNFAPPQTGGYVLNVRPQFYGAYYLDWGPLKLVTAIDPPAPTPTPAPTPGDCNGDHAVNGADVSAEVLEIFDGDGSEPAAVAGGSFRGDPIGCNPNHDGQVDAADLACLVNVIFGNAACLQ